MIDVAVFGAGRIGYVHALNAAAHPHVRLKYIVDPIASAHRAELAEKTNAAIVEAETVFNDGDVDGVIIASSTNTHAALLLRSVEARKAVFCEKPISLDFATVAEVTAKVEASGIACMLGFQRRYDASFRALRERIASGVSGRLEQLTMSSRDPAAPSRAYVETSGGMFRDSTIHDMDMARFLFDEDFATVYAVGGCLISPEIGAAGDIDSLMVTLTTASGRMAQIVASRRGPMGYDQRLEALCGNEVLAIENQPKSLLVLSTPDGRRTAAPENYFIERFRQAYRDEINAFVAMIEHGEAPLAGIRDGYEAQRLVEAAIVSMNTGSAVQFGASWVPGGES